MLCLFIPNFVGTSIEDSQPDGCQLKDLLYVLPSKTRDQVQWLLKLLRLGGVAHSRGHGVSAFWHPGPHPEMGAQSVKEESVLTDED